MLLALFAKLGKPFFSISAATFTPVFLFNMIESLEVEIIKLCENSVLVCKEKEKQAKCDGEWKLACVKQRCSVFGWNFRKGSW
jgi:hypothetical protein